MKNNKKTITLAAKAIGGIAFLCVFLLNVMLFVQKDSKSSNLSLDALKAYAQTGGEDGENGEGGGENGEDRTYETKIETTGSFDIKTTTSKGSCTRTYNFESTQCEGTGDVECTPDYKYEFDSEIGSGC